MAGQQEDVFDCFKDRVVLITGAAGTLGSDASVRLAHYGANLVLIDNHEGRLQDLKDKLLKHPEDKVLFRLGDVTRDEDVNQLVEDAVSKFGRLNHLINIVGVKRLGTMCETTQETFEENFMDVRVTFRVTKACIPHLLASKGSVVNISSVASTMNYKTAVPYCTAKASLNHMTKLLAADMSPKGVRVNCVCPSSVYSDYQLRTGAIETQEELDEYFAIAAKTTPMKRVARVEEVTQPILFLLSDAAAFITGTIVPIDGAYGLASP